MTDQVHTATKTSYNGGRIQVSSGGSIIYLFDPSAGPTQGRTMLNHCTQFASLVLSQRIEIVNTLKRYLLKFRDDAWLAENFGDGSDPGVSSRVFVSGKIVRSDVKDLSDSQRKDLDEVYRLAISEAAVLPAASYVLSELKALYEAHSILLNEAIESAQTFSDHLPSFGNHCDALKHLWTSISVVPAERPDVGPFDQWDDDRPVTSADIVDRLVDWYGLDKATRTKLAKRIDSRFKRWRKNHFDLFTEIDNRNPRDPKYLYTWGDHKGSVESDREWIEKNFRTTV